MGKVETFTFGELFEHSDANFHCLIMETPIIIVGSSNSVWEGPIFRLGNERGGG